MDNDMCENFSVVIQHYPDELNIHDGSNFDNITGIRNYCLDRECKTELDKINAVCLWLLNENIAKGIDYLSNDQVESFIIYIMIWLNYKLNLKKDEQTNLNNLYTNHIEKNENYINCKDYDENDCNSKLKEKAEYNNFKEIMYKRKDLLDINFEDISKFFEAFKLLCKMHDEFNEKTLECTEYLGYANKIVGKFKELNENSSATGNTLYSQVWSTLSTDYDNFKENYNDICESIPSFPSIKITQHQIKSSEHGSVQNYGVTSSSLSIVNKLILALSIFSAITIFLGIFYKCSLFVLRKRAQKQHLREKLKNIKKRM
ncbi:YIR protein, partial [Plasmodium yoelii]